jgi:Queuosine salvage protein
VDRREFLGVMVLPLLPRASSSEAGHPILGPVEAVVSRSRHVAIHRERIEEVAGWMAFESLPWPDFRSPLIPQGNDADTMDFIFLTASINFAFTDFAEHVVFRSAYEGREYSDSDAMMACLKRSYEEGTPILTGRFLRNVTRKELSSVFSGNIGMPMLDERLAIFHEVGEVLETGFQGRFHRFMSSSPRRVYDSAGGGLLERLVAAFPSFRDESSHRGASVRFDKRAQLLLWQLHARFRDDGFFALEDPERLTIFADYIVPVALRLFGITSYSAELDKAIQERRVIPKDSEEEVEIRAASIWACHLLTAAINAKRPPDRQIIDPVVDGRLWTHYHETQWPHHLTVTTAY